MGCKEHLSDLHRNTSKTEATSTPDSNHSGASGRVRLKTTHRGNSVQKLELACLNGLTLGRFGTKPLISSFLEGNPIFTFFGPSVCYLFVG